VKTMECIAATQSRRAYISLLFLDILGTHHLHAHRSSKDLLLLSVFDGALHVPAHVINST
jgi:hypothetical protein